MKLKFLDRKDEVRRLRRALEGDEPVLAVVYGRRRCGKSTLLQQVRGSGDVYFLADQRESPLQIQSFAEALDEVLPDFSQATYDSWSALLTSLMRRASGRLNIFIDEFPYLVQSSPDLPSVLQRFIDAPGPKKISWVLCGSSQRMMQGAILDRTAPLYGRAQEILRVRPLRAGWIETALGVRGREAVEAYAVWGGVPRYWELAQPFETTREAMAGIVLDRDGVLHDEPARLLQDDMRSSVQAQSLLSLVGGGCHRLSEIAGRLGKPAGSLTRPLGNLVELGYVVKERPWGESARTTKRTLCRIADPFLRFYFRFVVPNRSLLETGATRSVMKRVTGEMNSHCGGVWEDLVRESIPLSSMGGKEWNVASRWWGHDTQGRALELDVVAESMDRDALLIGEVKWGDRRVDPERELRRLKVCVSHLPFVRDRRVVFALWASNASRAVRGLHVFRPENVLGLLR